MDIAQQENPSLWSALLWKDFQQVKSTFVSVLVGVFGVQLILLMAASLAQSADTRAAILSGTVTLACIAPILLAIGCSGMMIGQERQTGTWGWSSSLPVSWRQALGSKLLVSVFGSLCASIPLTIISIGLLLMRQLETSASSIAAIYFSALTLTVFLEVIAYFFLASLLMRETLSALAIAGIGLAIGQTIFGSIFMTAASPVLTNWGAQAEQAGMIASAIFVSSVLLVGFLLMAIAFRWRWGVGQQATLTFQRGPIEFSLPRGAPYRYAWENAPSEWWMMLRHSCANSFWLRVGAFVGMLSLCLLYPPFLQILVVILAIIIGLTTFEGDQSHSRFRFLADRGVDPWKFVVSRLSVSSLWAITASIAFVPLITIVTRSEWFVFALVPGFLAFLIAALASMCFRKSVIAVTASLAVCFASFLITAMIVELVHKDSAWLLGQHPSTEFYWIVWYCCPFGALMILPAIFVFSKRWLVLDDARLAPHFAWISLTALLSPVFLASTFGFLIIPIVAWQGTPIEELSANKTTVPNMLLLSEPILTDLLPRLNILSNSRGRGLGGVAETANSVVYSVQSELESRRVRPDENLVEMVKPLLLLLEQGLNGPRQQTSEPKQFTPRLENLIARTAALATVALQCDDSECAVRLWRMNRELQEIAHQFDPLNTHASRNVAMYLLEQVNDHDVMAMGEEEVFDSLIPSVPNEKMARKKEIRDDATNQREQLLGRNAALPGRPSERPRGVSSFYLPLRWRNERLLAVNIGSQFDAVKNLRANFLTGDARDALLFRLSQLQSAQAAE